MEHLWKKPFNIKYLSPMQGMQDPGIQHEPDVLRRELDAARERETTLLQMWSQMQQQNQRLLEAATRPIAPSPPPLPSPYQEDRELPSQEAPTPRGSRGAMRRRIVALLREHPADLSPLQTRQQLGIAKDLAHTMHAMWRDGLVRRVERGRYVVA
jgi:hypothetical protein